MYRYNRLPDGVPFLEICKAIRLRADSQKKFLDKYLTDTFNFAEIITTSSGRQALALALQLVDPSKPEVIIPAYGCPIVQVVVEAAGKTPVYADIDPDTFTIAPVAVMEAITEYTGAIILVHEFGNLMSREAISIIQSNFNGIIIEDAASAIGSRYTATERFGQLGDMTILSGSLGKPIGGVHWGALAINVRFARKRKSLEGKMGQNTQSGIASITKALIYGLIQKRGVYDIVRNFLNFISDKNSFSVETIARPATPFDTRLMWQRYQTLENWAAQRHQKTNQILDILHQCKLKTINTHGNKPALTRVPFYAMGKSDQLIHTLRDYGIEAQRPFHHNFSAATKTQFPNTYNILQNTLSLTVTRLIDDTFCLHLEKACRSYLKKNIS